MAPNVRPAGLMKLLATKKAEQNRAALDPWTVVHFAAGLAAGLMDIPLRWALPVALGYEVVEQVFEREEWGQELFRTHGPETISNAIVDSLVFWAGHELGQGWNRTG